MGWGRTVLDKERDVSWVSSGSLLSVRVGKTAGVGPDFLPFPNHSTRPGVPSETRSSGRPSFPSGVPWVQESYPPGEVGTDSDSAEEKVGALSLPTSECSRLPPRVGTVLVPLLLLPPESHGNSGLVTPGNGTLQVTCHRWTSGTNDVEDPLFLLSRHQSRHH